MGFVQVENVIGGRFHRTVALGQQHGLQYVDRLGQIGHGQPVTVADENIQRQGGDLRVPQSVLLV